MRCLMRRSGFTLIELLVVIAIIAILAAILFPIFVNAQMTARGTKCMSNLKQMGQGLRQYSESWNSRFMPSVGFSPAGASTWVRHGFPYVLRQGGYVRNAEVFLCPSAPKRPQDFVNINTVDAPSDINGPDRGWMYPDTSGSSMDSRSHYGMNLQLGGWDPVLGWQGPPTDSDVRESSKIIYTCDAVWPDLWTGTAARIGKGRDRHNKGRNVYCVDGHCKWVPEANALVPTSVPKWDIR